jgi:hypothetical protein
MTESNRFFAASQHPRNTTSIAFASVLLFVVQTAAAQTPTAPAPREHPIEQPSTTTAPSKTRHEAEATVGAVLNGGNVQGAAVRVGGFYAVGTGRHAVRLDLSLGLAALAVDADHDPANGFTRFEIDGGARTATLLDNINSTALARVRYDFFLVETTSLYSAVLTQHDSALNLLARLRAEVGGRQFVFRQPAHSLALELGAAYTLDDGIFDATDADTNRDGRISVWGDATAFEKSGGVLAARAALVYVNTLLRGVSVSETLEVLPNLSFDVDLPVVGFVDAPFEKARLDGDGRLGLGEATLASSVTTLSVLATGGLALGLTLTLAYDAGAIARRNAMANADGTLAAQLGYRFF